MHTIVIYGSRTGNTERLATAIAESLRQFGPVKLQPVEGAWPEVLPGTDLLIVGGPTEGHGMTEPIKQFLDTLQLPALDPVFVAAFDTRLSWPRLLSGSAAEGIAQRLVHAGGDLVVPAESFIVTRVPELEPGELERAVTWATSVAQAVMSRVTQPVVVAH